ncbi:MAG: Type 1 glutamine amidotransferase-like domain-containing protein [Candidatus Aenigmarchaeota archaeon]|nr:Type 1 glutamine amidotransferase-like domain-containing protein [Candidatus Aenigmarchaeota archaeon]
MKRLFLASSIDQTAKDIVGKIGKNTKKLKAAFMTTAVEAVHSKDLTWFENNRQGLINAGFDLFDYTITGKKPEHIERDLGDCDVIHVNGGNVFYLLLQAQKSGFDNFIKNFVAKGGIYIGSSAGSIIASPNIGIARKRKHEDFVAKLKTFEGFGLVDFIVFPHWASDNYREDFFNERLKASYVTGNKIILLTDSQYVLVEDGMYKIVDI